MRPLYTPNAGRVFFVLILAMIAPQSVFPYGAVAQVQPGSGQSGGVADLVGGVPVDHARSVKFPDGYYRFLAPAPGAGFGTSAKQKTSPEGVAQTFLMEQARAFYDEGGAIDFEPRRVKTSGPRSHVFMQQYYGGVEVFGAQVMVQVSASGRVEAVLSDIMRSAQSAGGQSLTLDAKLTEAEARALAVSWAEAEFDAVGFSAAPGELAVYAPHVVGNVGPAILAWKIRVYSAAAVPVDELTFVDARTGKLAFHYSLIHEAKNRLIYDANNTTADPGTLARSEGDPATGDSNVDEAYDYLGNTYDFYLSEHGRDSIDGAGMTLSATVRYGPMQNAFWWNSRMYFGEGFQAADDVVAHELTHGVTENESNLIYSNQSGAINESFSDMWGEWMDQWNGAGTDTPAVKWLMGEDVPGFGAIRDMANPPAFGDPDRMGSPYFYTGSGDNGGVHINSGVGNKLCYLLTDGNTFNGRTVYGMGISAVADLMYEAQTNLLTPSSDYEDLYSALTQAAINLGWSQADKDNLEQACQAVEIRILQGVSDFAASTSDGVAQIDLSWTNPAAPTFTEVIVRRSTAGYPTDPASGTLVYQGTGTSMSDSSVTLGTHYFYSAWASHGAEGYSAPSKAAAIAGEDRKAFYTEQFFSGTNDLHNQKLTFTPLSGGVFYDICGEPVSGYPTDPASGSPINLPTSDDGSVQVTLGGGATVPYFGIDYGVFFINMNGNISFNSADSTWEESLAIHYAQPRISGLFDDLNPSAQGSVILQSFVDRLVVTFSNVREYATPNSNNFQIEMFFDGAITLTHLNLDATDGIVGLSQGGGEPAGFVNQDLSAIWDKDEDTLSDCWEIDHGLNPNVGTGNHGASGDPDGDGLTNAQEQAYGTDPQNGDTDGDGFNDGYEVLGGTSPTNPANYPRTLLWVNFSYASFPQNGAEIYPFDNLTDAIAAVDAGGVLRIRGDVAVTSTAETPRITKTMRLEASGGAVSIGR